MPTNLNWLSLVAAIVALFGWAFPNIPADIRMDILYATSAVFAVLVVLIHTFVNNAAPPKLKQAQQDFEATVKKLLPSLLVAVLGAGLLAGCSSLPSISVTLPSDPNGAIQAVAAFTISDLQAADADAVAHNDTIAHACYPALIQFVASQQGGLGDLTVRGAFGAFQRARDLKGTIQAGVPNYLTLGCGPLYAQVHADLLLFLAGTLPRG